MLMTFGKPSEVLAQYSFLSVSCGSEVWLRENDEPVIGPWANLRGNWNASMALETVQGSLLNTATGPQCVTMPPAAVPPGVCISCKATEAWTPVGRTAASVF